MKFVYCTDNHQVVPHFSELVGYSMIVYHLILVISDAIALRLTVLNYVLFERLFRRCFLQIDQRG